MVKTYKLIVYVPVEHADEVRDALGRAGAGRIGNYEYASFSSKGTGRFKPTTGAKPAKGEVGRLEEVEEEKIEAVVEKARLREVLSEIRFVHPYEEPAIEVIKLENL